MISRNKTLLQTVMFGASISLLSGCLSSDSEPLPDPVPPTSVVPITPDPAPEPGVTCDAPEVPNEAEDACVLPPATVTPADNEAVIFYNREDADYDGWVLHLWNNDTCPDTVTEPTNWPEGPSVAGVDPVYGGYYIVPLLEGYSECMNFIVHDADGNKDLSQDDRMMDLSGDRMAWTISGYPEVFTEATVNVPVSIQNASVHWVGENTLVWPEDSSQFSDIRLYWSMDASLAVDIDTGVNSDDYASLSLLAAENDAAAVAISQPSWDALTFDAADFDVKELLKGQLVVVGYDLDGDMSLATKVQTARVLDALYTSGENDADEAVYGPQYSDSGINVSLWAPTAQSMNFKLFDAEKNMVSSEAMTLDADTGIWTIDLAADADRMFYRFEATVFHPVENAVVTLESTDPYSVSVATNGRYSQLVNLSDDDLKPEGWDSHESPVIENFEDSVIYEAHIRDFSAMDESVSEENRGKYLAYTETNSTPVEHLQGLVDAGLNFYHIMPANDIASINEDDSQVVNIHDTVADLCALNSSAPVCGVEDDSATLLSVFESYDPASDAAQALASAMRGYDSFNWGYDPHHFNVPDGAYASEADGVARIKEMRMMIKALHDMGLRVALDVVYNHTNASGTNLNSVFDKVVPGYYHRYNQYTGEIERSTCCDNTATENRMMAKFMSDSLVLWAQEYRYDSFRFDLMGHIPKAAIMESWEAVQSVDPDNYFYGEGWDFGEVAGDRLFEQATQKNMAGTEVGTFNDQIREAIRGGAMFSGDTGAGTLRVQDKVRMSLAGTLTDFQFLSSTNAFAKTSTMGGYATDPADIINYVSKHDNETLWDQFNYSLPDSMSLENRVRAQNIALAKTLLSQGIPFLQQGGDLLRSKSMDRNTYDAGDWFNRIDFSMASHNWNIGWPLQSENGGRWDEMIPLLADSNRAPSTSDIQFASSVFKEFLQIRQSSPLFRLTSGEDVMQRIGFHNVGTEQTAGLIVMSIDDGAGVEDLDANYDALIVVINTTDSELTHSVPTASGLTLHSVLQNSVDAMVASAMAVDTETGADFTVPAYTAAVFVKAQGEAQGAGISPYATIGEPDFATYGDTPVYIRGTMNEWGTANPLSYQGEGLYTTSIALEAGTEYFFKFASSDWSTVNFGGGDAGSLVTLGEPLVLASGGSDLSFTAENSETYIFAVDASDASAPSITIQVEEPFPGTTVYLRGTMNDWSESDAFSYEGAGDYAISVNLTAGDYEFKVASSDWNTVNFGSNGAPVEVGSVYSLVQGAGNLMVTIPADGDYVFTFNASDTENTTLSIFEAGMYGETPVYVRGTMNDWGAVDLMEFDGSKRYSVDIELAAGDYEFKVASEDWSTVDFGAGSTGNVVTIGQKLTLARVGGDLSLNVADGGLFRFELLGPDPENPQVLVTKLD